MITSDDHGDRGGDGHDDDDRDDDHDRKWHQQYGDQYHGRDDHDGDGLPLQLFVVHMPAVPSVARHTLEEPDILRAADILRVADILALKDREVLHMMAPMDIPVQMVERQIGFCIQCGEHRRVLQY